MVHHTELLLKESKNICWELAAGYFVDLGTRQIFTFWFTCTSIVIIAAFCSFSFPPTANLGSSNCQGTELHVTFRSICDRPMADAMHRASLCWQMSMFLKPILWKIGPEMDTRLAQWLVLLFLMAKSMVQVLQEALRSIGCRNVYTAFSEPKKRKWRTVERKYSH